MSTGDISVNQVPSSEESQVTLYSRTAMRPQTALAFLIHNLWSSLHCPFQTLPLQYNFFAEILNSIFRKEHVYNCSSSKRGAMGSNASGNVCADCLQIFSARWRCCVANIRTCEMSRYTGGDNWPARRCWHPPRLLTRSGTFLGGTLTRKKCLFVERPVAFFCILFVIAISKYNT